MQKVSISAHYDAPSGNEENIKQILASFGPLAVGVDASQWGFEHYASGIYNDPNCNNQNVYQFFYDVLIWLSTNKKNYFVFLWKLNHAVIVIGYGTENGRDYWLIKNR